jgi:hypothetical protein
LSLLAAPLNDNTPVHGNTLESPRSTWVYRLHDTDDPEDTLKYGITSRKPPESRYSPAYYMDNEAAMERIMLFPNRAQARQFELGLCLSYVAVHGSLPQLSKRC